MSIYEGPLLFCDIEATHINPRTPRATMLEIGMVITEGADLTERSAASLLIRPPGAQIDHDQLWASLDPAVRDMHERTGLWKEATVGEGTWLVHEADDALWRWLSEEGVTQPISLCGSGVERYDRPWLEVHMPRLFSRLTYYSVWDLGTHRRALQYSGRGDLVDLVADVDNKPHRALADARLHIAEARRYAQLYERIPPYLRPETLHDADCPMTNGDPASRTTCICDGLVAGGREPIRDTPVGGGG